MRKLPSAERVRELLDYDSETGALTWRRPVGRWGRIPAGSPAGVVQSNGYRAIEIDGVRYLAHRLAWLHAHGKEPSDAIDHINGNTLDNRIANLRDVEQAENCRNQQRRAGRPVSGATYLARIGKWRANISDGGNKVLGYFETQKEAEDAYDAARAALGRPPVVREPQEERA
jgi:hypothetical protein